MRSLAGKLSLRKKKDPPSEGPPIICGLAIPEQVGEYQERKKIAYSQNSQVLSRSFSRTQTVSRDKNTGSGRVEVTSTWNYKTAGSNQFGPDESPYGVMELPTFGSQWGMATSKTTEETQSPYGNAEISLFESQYGVKSSKAAKNIAGAYSKADVSLYGPQYGITALSPDDDLYGDSDEERRNNKHIRKLTTVQVVEVSSEVEASNATMNPSPNKTIAQGLYSRLMSINKKNDIAYEGSDKEITTKATIPLTQSATAFPHLQQDSSFHQVIALTSHPKQFSRPLHDTSYNSQTLMDEPIDPFADLRGPISSYGDIDVAFTTKIGPKSCIICTEDFSAFLKPPPWITISCTHEPSVCCGCMALCIKSDLESKIWNQITCPECKTLLVYEDIQRLADPETFAKYEVLSFRNAIGKDDNFVWCQQCDFGQLHTGGNEQPIVRCMKCGFRSCFRHAVPWHDRLTCQEYDEMMNDPDGFKSAIERDDEAAAFALKQQHETDERMARELEAQDRREEENRQKAAHEEELRIAREAQAAEAERKRLEKEAEEERKRIEKEAEERAKRLEEIKRRKLQEELSLKTVESTTKKCPGCGWPIEKNHGCSHMTCIKCRSEFCWSCLNDYKAIRKLGNSEHKPTCKFHSDNLPDLDDEDVDPGEDSDSDSDSDTD